MCKVEIGETRTRAEEKQTQQGHVRRRNSRGNSTRTGEIVVTAARQTKIKMQTNK